MNTPFLYTLIWGLRDAKEVKKYVVFYIHLALGCNEIQKAF